MLDDVTVLAESVAEPPPPACATAVLAAIAAEAAGRRAATPRRCARRQPGGRHRPSTSSHRWCRSIADGGGSPATAAAAAIVIIGGALIVTRDADAPTDDMMAAVLEADDAVARRADRPAGALRLVKSEDVDATVLVGDGIDAPDDAEVHAAVGDRRRPARQHGHVRTRRRRPRRRS